MANPKLSKSKRQEIFEKYENGLSTYQLTDEYPVSRRTISNYLKKQGLVLDKTGKCGNTYPIDRHAFSQLTEKSIYWIGFIMADGNVTGRALRVAIQRGDKPHLRKLKGFLKSGHPISDINYQGDLSLLVIYNKKIIEDLREYGIVENKSLKANCDKLKNNRHFWRGMVDGDGWVTEDYNNAFGLTGSRKNVENFKSFCKQTTDSKASIRKCKNSYTYKISANKAQSTINRLYSYQCVALDRKEKTAKDKYGANNLSQYPIP